RAPCRESAVDPSRSPLALSSLPVFDASLAFADSRRGSPRRAPHSNGATEHVKQVGRDDRCEPRRSSASMGAGGGPSDPKLRIERVAEPVAEQVDAERREGERRARKRGEPPGEVEEVAALGQQ